MNRAFSFRINFYLFVCLFLLQGCSNVISQHKSGFLGDYSKMVESDFAEGIMVERNPNITIGDYSKFMVMPVQIYFEKNSKSASIDATKLKELADHFHDTAVAALKEKYEVVEQPGEGVLLIRAALTDVVPNKVYLNLHWSTTIPGFGLGKASMEAEFLDSVSNERVLAVIDARKGKNYHYTKGLTKWGHTKDIIDNWVDLLIKRLDQLHGNAT